MIGITTHTNSWGIEILDNFVFRVLRLESMDKLTRGAGFIFGHVLQVKGLL